ncbi:AMP-dependent synthetase/ligase [Spirulina subsalsa]|uniref:AMP-dependent synthetase/ligase n=1 Tax=Spirulina subsalsa TaxID=54311 RepID=UPI0002DB41DC|nr:long-chain fatty acid--CoA ligase [Spirulina subsalsa]
MNNALRNGSASLDYSRLQGLSELWPILVENYGEIIALHDPHSKPEVILTYAQLYEKIKQFAAGLQGLGVKPHDKVALFADNSPRWFIADQGILLVGAADAVRSSQAERQELLYIFEHSDSTSLVVQDLATLRKLQPDLADLPVQFVVLLSDETPPAESPFKIVNFAQCLVLGEETTLKPATQTLDMLATLIYTSGTTGRPKGVMLTHGNFLHQVNGAATVIEPQPGDRALSILPSWHSYERSVEYFLLSRACTQIYTSIRTFKKDITQFKPHFMVGVPRLWESIYEGVQKSFREQPASKQRLIHFFLGVSQSYVQARRIAQNMSLEHPNPSSSERFLARLKALSLTPLHLLGHKIVYTKIRAATGGCVKAFISGGGSLARHIDAFFELLDIPILVGYGLTETSPIATVRRPQNNLRGSSGLPVPYTEIRIVDPTTRQTLPNQTQGLVLIRGPQVMRGYYKNPEATAKAIDPEGWFDSGDLGMITHGNQLVLTGRAKDTIVLSNGENIEPQPIEDACICSPYIDQMMLVGQDQKMLGALIVPNFDALQKWVTEEGLGLTLPQPGDSARQDLDHPKIMDLFRQELNQRVKERPGYRLDDRVGVFRLIPQPFTMENGQLTQTLKMRRPVIAEQYRDMIDGMFERS